MLDINIEEEEEEGGAGGLEKTGMSTTSVFSSRPPPTPLTVVVYSCGWKGEAPSSKEEEQCGTEREFVDAPESDDEDEVEEEGEEDEDEEDEEEEEELCETEPGAGAGMCGLAMESAPGEVEVEDVSEPGISRSASPRPPLPR